MTGSALTFLIAQALTVAAPAGPPQPPSSPPSAVSEITVTARREAAMASFVANVGQTVGDGQLATWKDAICPTVIGLDHDQGEYVMDRLKDLAHRSGVRSAGKMCQPNLFVYFTNDPAGLAASLFKQDPAFFYRIPPSAREMSAPVYWRHGVDVSPADGSSGSVRCLSNICFLSVDKARDSRILLNVIYHLNETLIIINTDKVNGITLRPLSGFIAMVALAQISSDATFAGADTILNLFADRDAGKALPADVTNWDLGYLQSLYASRSDVPANAERIEILYRFRKAVTRADAGDQNAR